MKSNPSDEIIDIMIKNGIGFDVASIKFSKRCEIESSATTRIHSLEHHPDPGCKLLKTFQESEMDSVITKGADKTKLVYANPTRSIEHLKYAQENGVDLLVFDHEDELEKIAKYHPKSRLLIRIVTNDMNSRHSLSVKFGAKKDQKRLKILRWRS